jgi:hypothetical protein
MIVVSTAGGNTGVDRRQRYVLSMTIAADGVLKDQRRVNVLHLATGGRVIGAKDMALDTQDYLYLRHL